AILVVPREKLQSRKGAGQVERRRQTSRGHPARATVRTDEHQLVFATEEPLDPDRLAEMLEIGAASQRDVLAVVDLLTRCLIDERTGAPAPPRSRLAQRDAQPRTTGQPHRRRQPGQTSPDNHDM